MRSIYLVREIMNMEKEEEEKKTGEKMREQTNKNKQIPRDKSVNITTE